MHVEVFSLNPGAYRLMAFVGGNIHHFGIGSELGDELIQ